jgi:hypothetical protein
MKLLYKPFGLLVGVIGGIVAGRVFRRFWGLLGRAGEAPTATDRDSRWREVIFAAAMKGAVFGVVKATIKRAGATGYAEVTGTWPGKKSAAETRGKR